MKKRKIASVVLGLALVVSSLTPVQKSYAKSINHMHPEFYKEEPAFAPGHVIVAVEPSSGTYSAESIFTGLNIDTVKLISHPVETSSPKSELSAKSVDQSNIYLLTLADTDEQSVTDAIDLLNNNPDVKYAEPDYIVTAQDITPNDTYYSRLYGLKKISAPSAWSQFTGDSSVVVGIIDSGVDYTHPDLSSNIWTNPGEIPNDGIDNDGNGYIDDVHGWNFAEDTNDPMDDNGHGTHCAGIIAAAGNNGIGVTGVTWGAQIAALKFLDADGSGTTSAAIEAINYANMMGIPITNNSWGGGGYSQALHDAISESGLFITAAGNEGTNDDTYASYPASFTCSNIISVAATDRYDRLASFSCYGKTSVDIAAPGVSIYSSVPGSSYEYMSGTSMATPYVTGAAVLLKEYDPSLSASEIKARILNSADKVSSLRNKVLTGGRLNINAALAE